MRRLAADNWMLCPGATFAPEFDTPAAAAEAGAAVAIAVVPQSSAAAIVTILALARMLHLLSRCARRTLACRDACQRPVEYSSSGNPCARAVVSKSMLRVWLTRGA